MKSCFCMAFSLFFLQKNPKTLMTWQTWKKAPGACISLYKKKINAVVLQGEKLH